MTEILTESFCERCGTRYTFETAPRRSSSLGRLGTMGRGLKHFVVMSDVSFDEAMAVARSEDEAKVTTAQLEVFHRTFNFCLQCRQYTCADCWNAVEGRCLTCAPMPVEELPPPVRAVAAPVSSAPAAPPPIVVEPTPAIDALSSPEPVAPERVPEPVAVVEAEPAEIETEPVAEPEPEPTPEPVAAEAPVAAPLVEPEPDVVESEPGLVEPAPIAEPVNVTIAPEPEAAPPVATPPAAEPSGSTGAAPFPGFQPGRSLDDEIAAYELRIAALAEPTAPEPPIQAAAIHRTPVPAPMAAAAAVWPPETAEPSVNDRAGLAPTPGTCRTCGLSISASARFCRRCGARQEA